MMVQFTSSQLKCWTEEMQEKREMEEIPLKVFINPKLQILDPDQVCVTDNYKGTYLPRSPLQKAVAVCTALVL